MGKSVELSSVDIDQSGSVKTPWPVEGWGHRTYLMGILNVTPDSFSDGGRYAGVEAALNRAVAMEADGADFLDVGAESTRPGAEEVSAEEEWARLEPVLEGLRGKIGIPISVDTYKPEVAAKALEAGAKIANDIFGFQLDARMAEVVALAGAGVVLMHNSRGAELEGDLIAEVLRYFEESLIVAAEAGIYPERIILDPGIGFGKTVEQNLELMRRFGELRELGFPLLLGASRKSVIGKTLDLPVEERLEGTLATTVAGVVGGADIVRVHDLGPNLKAARMADAIYRHERIS
ncbi:dihydropteroate synthase [Puniceicoccus vermicola]|uniref:Dihydropteroate synthase n=1 Tax=Puniceicoccus vermicola TaxID=388746 RepID=A0A7X1AWZ2_9BACT|nr:dihydropteroate synthase [Puniceicoccus vermicola]